MTDFAYTAKQSTGEAAEGMISADSIAQARELLRGRGLFPLSVSAAAGKAAKKRQRRGGRVRQADLLMLNSQLTIMSRSGVDLADALKGVAEECTHPVLQKALQQIYEDVASGETVSAALNRHSDIFGETYIVAIQAAEASGQMTEVLERLTNLLRYQIRLRNTIRGIMTYPLILFSVAFLVSGALILFVLPQFASVFDDLERPVPPSTKILLDLSVFLRSYFMYLIPVTALAVWAAVRGFRSESFRLIFDGLVMRIRGLGPAIQSLAAGRMFTLMGTMLQSGIPLLDAIGLCRTATGNRLLRQLFGSLEEDVLNGRGIAAGISAAECVPPGAGQMIATAERTGRLADVIQTVGEFYEEEGERQIKQAVRVLEPAIILSMGVFVSFIVMSVMLPLLDVTDVN